MYYDQHTHKCTLFVAECKHLHREEGRRTNVATVVEVIQVKVPDCQRRNAWVSLHQILIAHHQEVALATTSDKIKCHQAKRYPHRPIICTPNA